MMGKYILAAHHGSCEIILQAALLICFQAVPFTSAGTAGYFLTRLKTILRVHTQMKANVFESG